MLSAIGDGLATPFTVHSKVPRLASEVRARRVLDAMVTAGLLDCSIRPGRELYRKAGPLKKMDTSERKKKDPKNDVRSNIKSTLSLAILSVLHQHPWVQSAQLAKMLDADPIEVRRRLSKFFAQERIERRGEEFKYEYAINHKSRGF